MKIQRAKIATLALSACMALGVVCFAACGVNGKSAYEIWLEQGNTGTEQEFLNSLKGTNGVDGKDGKDGTNGTNGKDGVDGTNGKDGVDGTNGKDGVDGTNGKDGTNGTNGKDGATWHYGEGKPLETLGNEGDLYLDYTAWDVYAKKSTGWEKLGSMKGDSEPAVEPAIKDYGPITLEAGGTKDLSLDNVGEGLYYLVAETDSEIKDKTLYNEDPFTYDTKNRYQYNMYSPANGGEYRSVVYMSSGGTAATKTVLKNDSGAEIKLNSVKLVKCDLGKIEAGKEIIVPAYYNGKPKVTVPLSEELIGQKVKITLWSDEPSEGDVPIFSSGFDLFYWEFGDAQGGGVWTRTLTLDKNITELSINNVSFSNYKKMHINVKIKIELA